jgi:tRNA threonylcarbamoyladenosine biosynthesis protein TsaB
VTVLLLALETAADVCGVALHDGRSVIAESSLRVARRHSAALLPLAQALLEAAGRGPSDLTAVAVSAGPGSYTGLRIGASTAKGLCSATGAALLPVPTLHALALDHLSGGNPDRIVVPVLPSRRGEVYAAAYRVPLETKEEHEVEAVQPPGPLTLDEIPPDWLPDLSGVRIVGPAEAGSDLGAGLAKTAFQTAGLERRTVRPSPAAVARLGAALLNAGQAADPAAFEPDYLKAFVATRAKPIF